MKLPLDLWVLCHIYIYILDIQLNFFEERSSEKKNLENFSLKVSLQKYSGNTLKEPYPNIVSHKNVIFFSSSLLYPSIVFPR